MSSWHEVFEKAALSAGLAPQVNQFYFLRHGETDSNRNNIVQGHLDIPLNDLGLQQAQQAAIVLAQQPISHIISSPLSRARRTAEIVATASGQPIQHFDADLREKSFGHWEGQPAPKGSVWGMEGPQVETLEAFAQRVVAGLNRHLVAGTPLVVAHGGVRRVLMLAFGIPQSSAHFANAAPMRFTRRKNVWLLDML